MASLSHEKLGRRKAFSNIYDLLERTLSSHIFPRLVIFTIRARDVAYRGRLRYGRADCAPVRRSGKTAVDCRLFFFLVLYRRASWYIWVAVVYRRGPRVIGGGEAGVGRHAVFVVSGDRGLVKCGSNVDGRVFHVPLLGIKCAVGLCALAGAGSTLMSLLLDLLEPREAYECCLARVVLLLALTRSGLCDELICFRRRSSAERGCTDL